MKTKWQCEIPFCKYSAGWAINKCICWMSARCATEHFVTHSLLLLFTTTRRHCPNGTETPCNAEISGLSARAMKIFRNGARCAGKFDLRAPTPCSLLYIRRRLGISKQPVYMWKRAPSRIKQLSAAYFFIRWSVKGTKHIKIAREIYYFNTYLSFSPAAGLRS